MVLVGNFVNVFYNQNYHIHELVLLLENGNPEYSFTQTILKTLNLPTSRWNCSWEEILNLWTDDEEEIKKESNQAISHYTFPNIQGFHIIEISKNGKAKEIQFSDNRKKINNLIRKFIRAYATGYEDGFEPAYAETYWSGSDETFEYLSLEEIQEITESDYDFDKIEQSAYISGFQDGTEVGLGCGMSDH